MSESPDLAEVLAAHAVNYVDMRDVTETFEATAECVCGARVPESKQPAHQAQAWRDACTITTVEQLDALPFLTIIREIRKPPGATGIDYGPAWERRTSGWKVIAGGIHSDITPHLSAQLIWHPGWAR